VNSARRPAKIFNDRMKSFPEWEQRYRAITDKMRGYLEREQQIPISWQLHGGSDEQLQRSRGSCGATLRPEAAAWSIERRQRNGMATDLLAAQSSRSLRSTRHCEPMLRNDWLASSSLRAGLQFPARLCAGTAAGMDRGSIGGGQTPGARSRLLAACPSTSRTMKPRASATKPSIKRCSFKVAVLCAAS
jgi:hypothetical protein